MNWRQRLYFKYGRPWRECCVILATLYLGWWHALSEASALEHLRFDRWPIEMEATTHHTQKLASIHFFSPPWCYLSQIACSKECRLDIFWKPQLLRLGQKCLKLAEQNQRKEDLFIWIGITSAIRSNLSFCALCQGEYWVQLKMRATARPMSWEANSFSDRHCWTSDASFASFSHQQKVRNLVIITTPPRKVGYNRN